MTKGYLSELGLSEKEEKILESAIKVFSEKGYSGATTSEIAKNAGVAEGTIFRYFKTKKDILRGIVIQTVNIFSEKIVLGNVEKIFSSANEKDIRSILKELIMDRLKLLDSVFPMARIIFTEALFHDDVREAIYKNIIEKALEIFKNFHKVMLNKGIIRNDIEPEVLFRCIIGNTGILLAQQKLFGDKLPLDNIENEVEKVIDIILYGVISKNNI